MTYIGNGTRMGIKQRE